MKLLQRIGNTISGNSAISNDVLSININRLFYMSLVAAPVHLLHVMMFAHGPADASSLAEKWRQGILAVHSVEMILMSLSAAVLWFFRRYGVRGLVARAFLFAFIMNFLAEGLLIVTIDQYVTTNITPFLVICTIIGVMILMRPALSIAFYAGTYAVYYFAIGVVQTSPEIVLTNRVNGITAVAIGICVSIILWQTNKTTVMQRREIENQRQQLEETNRRLAEANGELEKLSTTDELTGLSNRRQFNTSLSGEYARHARSRETIALIMADVDHFKNYNDTMGHQAGDDCLRQVASVFKGAAARPFDVAARYGGEEFAMILPRTDIEGARKVAERIQGEMARHNIQHPKSPAGPSVTLSFGIASALPHERSDLADLIRRADAALYASKMAGRNTISHG